MGLLGGAGAGAPLGGAGGPLGGAGGPLGSAPGGGALPTMNLLGGGLAGGGSQTPQYIQQMQAEAVRDPALDTLCPGKTRQTTDIGAECWVTIWVHGGCKAANVPAY